MKVTTRSGSRVHRGRFIAASVAAAALVLTGCSSSDSADAPAAEEATAVEEAAETAESEAANASSITWAHACGLPGCWYHVPMYVAQNFGFFDEYGADVTIQPFKSGGDIVQATQTGDITGGHIGTDPFLVGAPQGLNIKGIYGENKQDWILITRDPDVKECKDLAGKEIGAQAVGDARWLVLSAILDGCGEGLTIDDVQTIDPNNDYVGVIVNGVIDTEIVHLDELAQIEALTDDEWTVVAALSDLQELHYAMHVVNGDQLAANRDGIVKMTAGLIDATKFMYDPANFDAIVAYLSSQGIIKQDDPALAAQVFKEFLEFGQWEADNNGLDTSYLSNSIASQVKAGSIAEAYDPNTILDTTVWDEANALVQAKKG
jgi:ABC-type nitrate/sulfonate/bicarbonate transport system substrate-binding protein